MKKNNETLVVLSPAFPENESETNWVPSQQIFVRAVKKNFPGLNVIVLAFQYPLAADTYEWHGIKVISFGGMHKRKTGRLILWWNVWKNLRTICKINNVIGLFSFWCGECALIGKYFGKKYNIKHYCWLCGQDAREGNKLIKLIRPKANELIAMSNFLANEFYKNYGIKPARIIFNGIDHQLFPSGTYDERDIDILGAGSLIPLKQYEILISVVAKIKMKIPSVKAEHCGDGSERVKLTALINELNVGDNLFFAGQKMHEEVLRLMQRTKVFLHPSSYEGFGVVCLEALYAGAHVVSFSDPIGEKIEHWHIVRSEDEMYAKTLEILQNPVSDYKPVRVNSMDDSVKAVLQLFNYQ